MKLAFYLSFLNSRRARKERRAFLKVRRTDHYA